MDRSEVRRTCKEAKHPMGVYSIRPPQSKRVFVGFATNLPARFNRHKAELRFGTHRIKELQDIWNTCGEAAVEFEILDQLDHDDDARGNPRENLQVLTDMWLQKLELAGDSVIHLKGS